MAVSVCASVCLSQLYSTVADKMREMQKLNMSWMELQFLRHAVDVLCQCRQTLMYTYVFAYYLRKNNHAIIFEVSFLCLPFSRTTTLLRYCERSVWLVAQVC